MAQQVSVSCSLKQTNSLAFSVDREALSNVLYICSAYLLTYLTVYLAEIKKIGSFYDVLVM